MSHHGKIVCSCGELIQQCRCPGLDGSHTTETRANGCEKCRLRRPPVEALRERIDSQNKAAADAAALIFAQLDFIVREDLYPSEVDDI
jgi:hypothetical protein